MTGPVTSPIFSRMPDPSPIALRLKWRKTWPNREDDFVCLAPDDDREIGRIYVHDTGGIRDRQWAWFFGSASGSEPTAREAAKALEDEWFATRP